MEKTLTKLVLVRHGESKWNKENRFTGWTDVSLTHQGIIEAKQAGHMLKVHGYLFDCAYTSVLKRAIHTLWYILDTLNQTWLPVKKSWRLNERHYGALQGFNKIDIEKKYGSEQIKKWRRSFSSIPPRITKEDKRFPGHDVRYSNLDINSLPTGESLELTITRIIPYWQENIIPMIKLGKSILISAHGNSIRAIIKLLDNISEQKILELNIPTAIPLIYELNNDIQPNKHYYLSDFDKINTKTIDI